MTTSSSRAAAGRALWLVLGGGVLAWVLFLLAVFSDLAVEAGRTWEEIWGPDSVVPVRPSTYLYFAAVAVLALGGLFGRRLAVRAQVDAAEPSALARAVQIFASTVMLIGLVLAAWAAVVVFMSNFLGGGDDDAVVERVLNSYLPIVLYTALVIAVILTGFVFTRAAPAKRLAEPAAAPVTEPAAQTTDASPAGAGEAEVPGLQRSTALAYTLPIVAVAVALVFGLIVFDLTQTPLEAWIWVIVQVCIAAGIVAGTIFAARAIDAQRRAGARPMGVSVGAKNLNLVLSIVFAAAVSSMALGYGASAVNQLLASPSLSLYAYPEVPGTVSDDDGDGSGTVTEAPLGKVTLSADGHGLLRGTEGAVSLEPGGPVLVTEEVSRDGYLWINGTLDTSLEPGDYTLTARATTVEQLEIEVGFDVTVTDDGTVLLPHDATATTDDEPSRLIAPSASWVFGDFAPALLLLALVVATLALTLQRRNRDL